MTSTIGRTVQGADGQASVEGIAGLERLCRVFGSAEYLEKKMEDWSNDVFFVELWSELQDRVRQNRDSGRNVAGTMSVAEVASRTSPAVANTNGTQTAASTATASPLSPTSDLSHAMRVLSTQLSFLSRALGTAPLRRVSRQLLLSVQSYIWDSILTKHTFSETGAAQLASDVDHLCHVVDSALGASGQAGISLQTIKRLSEGLRILCLSTAGQGDVSAKEDVPLRLWDVEKMLFRDNESARGVLAELEIDSLSEAEARSVLERRVEIGS